MALPELIRTLADGRFHSGQSLAAQLGVSRTAVWKQIQRLQTLWDLEIESIRGKGYRLVQPLDLLEQDSIVKALGSHWQARLDGLEIHDEVDSTNSHLMAKALSGDRAICACLAERQTAGRGRRGRSWLSPFAANLYLSILWHSPRPPHQLGGLSLAMGVMVARLLHRLGFVGAGLKWPNDLICDQGKLGGLLIQLHGEGEGPSSLVIGLGLNLRMPAAIGREIDQPWCNLDSLGPIPSRSELAGQLIVAILQGLEQYDDKGLEPFQEDWTRFDLLHGKAVRMGHGDGRQSEGINSGIGPDGALLLRTPAGIERYHSGEVSLRGR